VSLKITPREVDGVTILDVVGRITLGMRPACCATKSAIWQPRERKKFC